MRNKTFFIVVLAAMLLVTACADTAIYGAQNETYIED